MKRVFIVFTMILTFSAITGQEKHVINQYQYKRPTIEDSVENRLLSITVNYKQYLPLPRVALYNIGYPHDQKECNDLNGFCVLELVCVTQNKDELPITKVRIIQDGNIIEIKELFSIKGIKTENSVIENNLGPYQDRYYFLIKYSDLRKVGNLVFDWNKNRNDFKIGQFPITDDNNYEINDISYESSISPNILEEFILREFEVDKK